MSKLPDPQARAKADEKASYDASVTETVTVDLAHMYPICLDNLNEVKALLEMRYQECVDAKSKYGLGTYADGKIEGIRDCLEIIKRYQVRPGAKS